MIRAINGPLILTLSAREGSDYRQDNWEKVSKTMTKSDFEAKRPQEQPEVILKETRSVFTTTEERERALKKLESFRTGIKKLVQSEDLKRRSGSKGKERI